MNQGWGRKVLKQTSQTVILLKTIVLCCGKSSGVCEPQMTRLLDELSERQRRGSSPIHNKVNSKNPFGGPPAVTQTAKEREGSAAALGDGRTCPRRTLFPAAPKVWLRRKGKGDERKYRALMFTSRALHLLHLSPVPCSLTWRYTGGPGQQARGELNSNDRT